MAYTNAGKNLSKCVSFNLNKNGFSDIIYRFYTCSIISLKFIYVVIWERGRVGETVGNSKVVNIKISPYIFLFFFFYNCVVPLGFLPWKIWVATERMTRHDTYPGRSGKKPRQCFHFSGS